MEFLEAFDLTDTLRGPAQLAGCDHKTVAIGCARWPGWAGGVVGRGRG